MLENIGYGGYTKLKIGNFEMDVDITTNVPCDLMKAFSDFLYMGAGIVSMRSDAYQFDLILSYTMDAQRSNIYMVDNDSKIHYQGYEIADVLKLSKELLVDIKTNINFWISIFNKKDLIKGLKTLEKNIKDYEQRRNKRVVR